MRRTMSLKSRRELLGSIAPRYKKAFKKEKQGILDEFTAATGYHRKYAVTLLNCFDPEAYPPSEPRRRSRELEYTPEVQEALVTVWEAANRICSKRLVPFLPDIVDSLERHGHLSLSANILEKLLAISPATVDRLLYKVRHGAQPHGIGTTKPGSLLKHQVPIRTFSDWNDGRPGFIEADLVAHCGDNVGGSFLHTLTMTDIATGWTECLALLLRDRGLVIRAIETARERIPFPLLGLDTDNGAEFLNYMLFEYCADEAITFTRSRPYKKNDQCHVEQKNGAIVRNFVGYDRFEGIEPCQILDELYLYLRLYVNFFQPSVKLISKKREGGRVRKKYDQARTPCQRVLTEESVPEEVKQELKAQFESLDPVALLQEIARLQDQLWQHAHIKPLIITQPVSLNGSESLLAVGHTVRRDGNRPLAMDPVPSAGDIHNGKVVVSDETPCKRPRRRYRRTKRKHGNCYVERWWRTREDPFADVWEEARQQLKRTPHIQAKALFKSLQQKYPWKFRDGQLRTFQRRVKAWRLEQASRQLEMTENIDENSEVATIRQGKILT